MEETVPKGEEFKLNAEIEIDNLRELHHVLSQVHEKSFRSHVTDKKNDFAAWVRHSVKDNVLADKLEKTLDFNETRKLIKERVEELEALEDEENEEADEQQTFDEKIEDDKNPFTGKDIFGLELEHLDVPPDPPVEDPYKQTPLATPKKEDKPAPPVMQVPEKSKPAVPEAPKEKPILPEIPKLNLLEKPKDIHPIERVKHNVKSVIFGFLLGLVAGLAIGYVLGMMNVLG
jgi:hypothetical protein